MDQKDKYSAEESGSISIKLEPQNDEILYERHTIKEKLGLVIGSTEVENPSSSLAGVTAPVVKHENDCDVNSLYEDHKIKEEMVIGPTVLQKSVTIRTDTLAENVPIKHKNKMIKTRNSKMYECMECDKQFRRKIYLLNHERRCHGAINDKFHHNITLSSGSKRGAERPAPYPPVLVSAIPAEVSPSNSTLRVNPSSDIRIYQKTGSGRLRAYDPGSEEENEETEEVEAGIQSENNHGFLRFYKNIERERNIDAENEELEREVAAAPSQVEDVPEPPLICPPEEFQAFFEDSLSKFSFSQGSQEPAHEDHAAACEDPSRMVLSRNVVVSKIFQWSPNFSSFRGTQETYTREPGPTTTAVCPYELFNLVWDDHIMESIVSNTILYAHQCIDPYYEEADNMPKRSRMKDWKEPTVAEMRLFFALSIYMSLDYRTRLDEYWTIGVLGMPEFRKIMSRDRFSILLRFLHFVDNNDNHDIIHPYERKVIKISPIVRHCNEKFSQMYIPKQELSLDESLLLWKGNLSWIQCIRTKAARFGIKSFDLCEAESGYLLKMLIYTGKEMSTGDDDGMQQVAQFQNPTAKVVMKLMNGYLDVGHTLYMNNWYNQMPLTRYLKARKTDVVGTQDRRHLYVPNVIKALKQSAMNPGQMVWRHCGDVTVVSWNDVKLVTFVSTFHGKGTNEGGQRAGRPVTKPSMVNDYNKYMGGVDQKDQMLSMYLMEGKRSTKWYIKVFRRLMNTTLLNGFIIAKANQSRAGRQPLTHRQFRFAVAEMLVRHNRLPQPQRQLAPAAGPERLSGWAPGAHEIDFVPDRRRRRCVRCSALNERKAVKTRCIQCNVGLCIGKCFREYHTVVDLRHQTRPK